MKRNSAVRKELLETIKKGYTDGIAAAVLAERIGMKRQSIQQYYSLLRAEGILKGKVIPRRRKVCK